MAVKKTDDQKFLEALANTPREKAIIVVERLIGEKSLYEFFKMCMRNIYTQFNFKDNWHYKVLCDILQERTEQMLREETNIKDLIINLPIRSGKSILISEIFPVWLWVLAPHLAIQNICSTQRLATKSSRISRNILQSDWFQKRWKIQLSQDNNAKTDYSTTKNGTRQSFGIDSGIIGSGYDVQIIDDPNDPSDNNSSAAIRNVIDVFTNVLVGRANNESSFRIVLQQRTSEKDLAGYLLTNNPTQYKHICLPGLKTEQVTPGYEQYYKEDLFFPELFSLDRLEKYKKELSPTAYASQILQQPSALEGNIIKREWVIDNLITQKQLKDLGVENSKKFLVLDTAYTKSLENDPSAFLLCTLINNKLYILRVEEFWLEFNELINKVNEYVDVHNIKEIYVENKASGLSLTQMLKKSLKSNIVIKNVDPEGKDKVSRCYAVQLYLSNGMIKYQEDLWNEKFIDQLTSFPFGAHDDMVDVLIYAVNKTLLNNYIANKQLKNNS